MRLPAIGHIYDLAADPQKTPLATLPLSEQLRIEREMLFSERPKKPRGKVKRLTNAELYYITEETALAIAGALEIDLQEIYSRPGLPRSLAIAICYLHRGFTMSDIAFMFNCERKFAIIAARTVEDRAIIDPDFRTLYRNLIQESKA